MSEKPREKQIRFLNHPKDGLVVSVFTDSEEVADTLDNRENWEVEPQASGAAKAIYEETATVVNIEFLREAVEAMASSGCRYVKVGLTDDEPVTLISTDAVATVAPILPRPHIKEPLDNAVDELIGYEVSCMEESCSWKGSYCDKAEEALEHARTHLYYSEGEHEVKLYTPEGEEEVIE